MTIFLRALYGPFGRDTDEHWSVGKTVRYSATQVDWHFFGIREDNTVGRWTIRFKLMERKWIAFAASINDEVKVGGVWQKGGFDPAFKDAFVPDKPMVYGRTYLEILKPRLSKEDVAFASRLALEAAR